jgi:hypothetical protein
VVGATEPRAEVRGRVVRCPGRGVGLKHEPNHDPFHHFGPYDSGQRSKEPCVKSHGMGEWRDNPLTIIVPCSISISRLA